MIPQHVAIIMDGNGRWARLRGKERNEGHIAGMNSLRETVRNAAQAGVKYLTVYAFSTENWKRPKEEVDFLMELLYKYLDEVVIDKIKKDKAFAEEQKRLAAEKAKLEKEQAKKAKEEAKRLEKERKAKEKAEKKAREKAEKEAKKKAAWGY